jgi:hypothetical protein
VVAGAEQLAFEHVGQRRLAGAGKTGHPDDAGLLVLLRRALGARDGVRVPDDVAVLFLHGFLLGG